MREDVKSWVLDFFSRKGTIPGETEGDKLKVDYFGHGLLESIEVVELILEAEEKFSIGFEPDNMQDPRFSTLGGLAEIISEIINSKERHSK